MSLEATYPSCAFILAGDFNRTFLPMIQSAVKSFNLKPAVTFSTRGDRILDQIFTNLGDYFSDSIRLPPFGPSDHATVHMGSSVHSASKPKHKIIKSRDKRPSKVNSVGGFSVGNSLVEFVVVWSVMWRKVVAADRSYQFWFGHNNASAFHQNLCDGSSLGVNTPQTAHNSSPKGLFLW